MSTKNAGRRGPALDDARSLVTAGTGCAVTSDAGQHQGALLERLRASADRIARLRPEFDAELAERAELITSLREAGMPWGKLAAAARLSPTRCVAICWRSGA